MFYVYCRCCFRKWVALYVNGISLPFYNRKLIVEYFKKAKAGEYVEQRNENILKTVKDYLKKKIYCIDIDGVLTNETAGHDYANRSPNIRNINAVNSLHRLGHRILLYTARYPEDELITKAWLLTFNVKYHELKLGKPQYDFIVDDKTISL